MLPHATSKLCPLVCPVHEHAGGLPEEEEDELDEVDGVESEEQAAKAKIPKSVATPTAVRNMWVD